MELFQIFQIILDVICIALDIVVIYLVVKELKN